MRVLVACEFSGVVREAFKARGHDAWSCDLLPTEIEGQHIQGDVLQILNQGWDLMIAHPPCTYLSNAGAVHYYGKKAKNIDERFSKGFNAKHFFMHLYHAPIAKICIENPQPLKAFCLPLHSQVIQPYQFGHPVQKRTLLWLKGLPELKATSIVENPQSTKIAGNWFNKGGKERQKNRAKTFTGIANAMASQWS
jgi:hypothetical protein